MFSIVQDIAHIGQQGDCGLYFGPNSPQSPGDIVSLDFFSMANSISWWYRKLVNCRKEHTKKHMCPSKAPSFEKISKSKTIDARSGPPRDVDFQKVFIYPTFRIYM